MTDVSPLAAFGFRGQGLRGSDLLTALSISSGVCGMPASPASARLRGLERAIEATTTPLAELARAPDATAAELEAS